MLTKTVLLKSSAILKNGLTQGVAALLLVLVIFFSTPLSTHTWFSADELTQLYQLTQTNAATQPHNMLAYDLILQVYPWLSFNKETLATGQMPLWNPYNANGMPHLANYQSGVFSIYSLPFYVLSFKHALLVAAFLELFLVGLFTFLYLKILHLPQVPALLGAIAFMFAGYNMVWLGWTASRPIVMIPAGLYFIEQIFAKWPAAKRLDYVGLTVSLAVGLLAGHPETAYTALLFIGLYTAFRLLRQKNLTVYNLFHLGLRLIVCAVLGIGLAAIQLIPFVEYTAQSDTQQIRGAAWQEKLNSDLWPLAIFPNALGTPGDRNTIDLLSSVSGTNYNETNGAYSGALILILAIFSLLTSSENRRSYLVFFAVVGILWLIYAIDAFQLKNWFNVIPAFTTLLYSRTDAIWLFCISVCAAFGVEALLQHKRRNAFLIVGIGLLILAVSANGVFFLLGQIISTPMGAQYLSRISTHVRFVTAHMQIIVISIGVGIGAAIFLSHRTTNSLASILLISTVFVQTGILFKDYQPISSGQSFYPGTPAIQLLSSSKNIAVFGFFTMTADMNMMYHLSTISSYDVLGIQNYNVLAQKFFGTSSAAHFLTTFSEIGLRLFGVDTLVIDSQSLSSLSETLKCCTLIEKTVGYFVYHYNATKYWTVDNSIILPDNENALAAIRTPNFDPWQTVILNDGEQFARQHEPSTVQILSENSSSVHLQVDRQNAGYLVMAMSYYPGWKARVNGLEQPVYRANYAFNAILLRPGANDVEFFYDPLSFRIGAAVTIVSLMLISLFLIQGVRLRTSG